MTDSSPFMKQVVRQGNRVVVRFAPVGGGLKTRDGKAPNSWELAGPDGKFLAARAEIAEDRVLISAEGILEPVAVRLGWSADSNCNLTNSEGLPAMPFSAKIE
jgi:sialate O-acetylesterase